MAKSLEDFRNVDDSKVFPPGKGPEIKNITQVGPYEFKFYLRHRSGWGDGDRSGEWNRKGHDKSRAEVSRMKRNGKEIEFKEGETWEIASTIWLAPDFVPSDSYCNLQQPVFDMLFLTCTDIRGDVVTVDLNMFSKGIGSKITTVRSVKVKRGEWNSFKTIVAFGKRGSVKMSFNGDQPRGLEGVNTTLQEKPWRSKYGLYGTMSRDVQGKKLGDSTVHHKYIYLRKL